MKRTLALACVFCAALAAPITADDDAALRWDGGIGVIPVSNVAVSATDGSVTVSRNIVRGVNPPGQIWVIRSLKAEISSSGDIEVRGRGLLLGGGNNIGLNGGQSVKATLICEAAAPFTLHDSGVVPLAANGDFRIEGTLSPAPPATCASPLLLIRNAAGTVWFAAGILKMED